METPDGPWAWLVLVASMMTYALTLGFSASVGVFYTDLQNSFSATNTETSWFPSIITAVLHAGGPLCSLMVERFGCRITVIVGGLLCGTGLVASSFSQNLIHLYLTAGFVGGVGLSLSFQAAVTVLGYYFIKRRTLANAIASSGASIGMALWPLASRYLLETMGWRGSFMIFGGVLLNCCVCGAVMRPVKTPPSAPGKDVSSSVHNGTSGAVMELEQRKGIQRYIAFDLLLGHRRYQIYTIGVAWMVLGFVLPLFYLVPYATTSGIEETTAALLLSLIGFINIFARPVAGIVSQHKIFSGKLIYLFSGAVIANGLSNLVCAASASFSSFIVYCCLYAISMSVIGALVFHVLMDIVGMKRFPGAFGLFTILESVTILIGPPLAGFLVDITGEYSYVFYFSCIAVSSSGLFMFLASYIIDRKEAQSNPKPVNISDGKDKDDHKNVIYRPAKQETAA
ncbi:PREDICTED: monocarboxylate transporter 6 [Nanorana parkeri]|uniref:monocarboxylate transporter 6 n=1 Tax=Nanorana parkeri TaxID=125878 RepID=UPI000854C052|nr:PREDICTED: monocarboxylate transporter 6 [Nanorana parkeri]